MNYCVAEKTPLEGQAGYITGIKLQNSELERVRTLIRKQWLSRIQQATPEHADVFAEYGMEKYHKLAHCLDHSSIWPKKVRILPPEAVAQIRQMSIFGQLESMFGEFSLSDEDNVGWEEIYWRLVRPNEKSDVGPLHADKWFWDLGHGTTPPNTRRVKVWIAIFCETGLSGLRIVPGSHLQDIPFHGEKRHGMLKPQIDLQEEELSVEMFYSKPGDAIVFHDKLIHGGAVTAGNQTRVSIEFTMFIPE